MYKCGSCGGVFETPGECRMVHTELDGNPYETFGVCPCCGSEEIEEAVRCGCGEYTTDVYTRLCEDCKKNAQDALSDFFNGLTQEERAYLVDEVLQV